jgi:hypothetical protein
MTIISKRKAMEQIIVFLFVAVEENINLVQMKPVRGAASEYSRER